MLLRFQKTLRTGHSFLQLGAPIQPRNRPRNSLCSSSGLKNLSVISEIGRDQGCVGHQGKVLDS